MENQRFSYNNRIPWDFARASILWALFGMVVGLVLALQLLWPQWNSPLSYFTFGRIRPVHTNIVIFAFLGNAMFSGIYYSLQRLCKARIFSSFLGYVHFWGWQLLIILFLLSFPLGITSGKEYSEAEWPADALFLVVWLVFGLNLLGTIFKRRTHNLYISLWFYLATFAGVFVAYFINSLNIPAGLFKSYPVFAGLSDAIVQWWYGNNLVSFFLIMPFLGLLYYLLPKVAGRPLYSYSLAVLHFWSLLMLFTWAAPHHLLYTSLPRWLQLTGVVFSLILIAPAWGGLVNGLLTLRNGRDFVREDPGLKFILVALLAYGISTLEGPLLSFKTVNALTHYTDWTIGHAHLGTLGWCGFLVFSLFYWMIPRISKANLYSAKLARAHLWIGTSGLLIYLLSMYIAAITQFTMLKHFTRLGFLGFPYFVETVVPLRPLYFLRFLGGFLYLSGVVLCVWNLVMTVRNGSRIAGEPAEAPALKKVQIGIRGTLLNRIPERRPFILVLLVIAAILLGGMIEVFPLFLTAKNTQGGSVTQPYTPLELLGREIYIREGCSSCHTQQVRPFRSETERFGEYAGRDESIYDHPFLWGSKRNGPDLSREGVVSGKLYKTDIWHFYHMENPRRVSARSTMPAYPNLFENNLDTLLMARKIHIMQLLGVPYPDGYHRIAGNFLTTQAGLMAEDLKSEGLRADKSKEIIALIAYLQRLGNSNPAREKFTVIKPVE